MPTQSEQNDRNQQSKDRVSDGQTIRDRRKAERAVKSRRKELLQGATSTSQRRDIKGGIYDISTTSTDVGNRQGEGETIDDNSIDSAITHTGDSSSGGLPDGYAEELLDIVDGNNEAAQRYFLTRTP